MPWPNVYPEAYMAHTNRLAYKITGYALPWDEVRLVMVPVIFGQLLPTEYDTGIILLGHGLS
jgi:hypothetical protein